MKNAIAIVAFAIGVLANIPYMIDIVKGRAKPERISWLLWTALGATYFIGALQGDGAILFTLMNLLMPAATFILSLKYGVGGRSWFGRICLIAAVIAFILMLVIDKPIFGLVLALLIDAIGSMLTIRKLLKDRTSETKLVWGASVISSVLSVIALENYSVENLLFPMFVILADGTTFLLVKSGKQAKASKAELKEIEKL